MSDGTGPNPDPMPVFPVLGKDRLALETISYYRSLCIREGLSDRAAEVMKAYVEMMNWQARNHSQVKAPDHKHVSAAEQQSQQP